MSYHITEECNGCTACARICPAGVISGEKKKIHYIDKNGCIECGACGRLCPTGAIKDSSGRTLQRIKRNLWEKPVFDRQKCMACVICVDACPVGCITLGVPDKKDPNAYPELIDMNSCIGCGFCAQECMVDAIEMNVPAAN